MKKTIIALSALMMSAAVFAQPSKMVTRLQNETNSDIVVGYETIGFNPGTDVIGSEQHIKVPAKSSVEVSTDLLKDYAETQLTVRSISGVYDVNSVQTAKQKILVSSTFKNGDYCGHSSHYGTFGNVGIYLSSSQEGQGDVVQFKCESNAI